MGNPLSSLLGEVFTKNLENELEEAGTLPRFWIRYVNDLLAIIKREEAGTILEKFNRAQRNIDFTMEIEKEGEISFLDLKIIREREDFEFDIYRKPTQTQRTITYTSNDDFHHKMAAYNFMIDRIVTTPLNEERRNKHLKEAAHKAVARHIIEQGHHMSVDNANILKEVNGVRRLDSYESLHISKISIEKRLNTDLATIFPPWWNF